MVERRYPAQPPDLLGYAVGSQQIAYQPCAPTIRAEAHVLSEGAITQDPA